MRWFLFKFYLTIYKLSGVSLNGQCLTNTPTSRPVEVDLTQDKLPGDFLTPDEQCKMIHGPTASFCSINLGVVCKQLYCRQNSIVTDCIATNGAADGTLCDSGKVCQLGSCVAKATAKTGTCLQGDDLILQIYTGIQLPTPQVKCSDYFNLITKAGQSISGHCNNPLIGDTCCQSCKSNFQLNKK